MRSSSDRQADASAAASIAGMFVGYAAAIKAKVIAMVSQNSTYERQHSAEERARIQRLEDSRRLLFEKEVRVREAAMARAEIAECERAQRGFASVRFKTVEDKKSSIRRAKFDPNAKSLFSQNLQVKMHVAHRACIPLPHGLIHTFIVIFGATC